MEKILIIAAMEQEVNAIAMLMKDVSRCGTHLNGTLNGIDCYLVEAGIGKVNAAHITTKAIIRFEPTLVINTGSAGSLSKDLKVGDVVVGTEVAHHDVDVTAFDYELGQVPQMPKFFTAKKVDVDGAVFGQIISGDQFISKNKIDSLIKNFPNALCVEMEAAAIAQVAHKMEVPFIIVRSISDNPFDEENNIEFKKFLDIAASNSAKIVAKILEKK